MEDLNRDLDQLNNNVPLFAKPFQGTDGGVDIFLAREMGATDGGEGDANMPTVCLSVLQTDLRLHRKLRSSGHLVKVFGHSPGLVLDENERISVTMATNSYGLCLSVLVCPLSTSSGKIDWSVSSLRLCQEGEARELPFGRVILDCLESFSFPRGSRSTPVEVDGSGTASQLNIRIPLNALPEHRGRLFVCYFVGETCFGASEPMTLTRDVYLPFYRTG